MRDLQPIAGDAATVFPALRAALSGDGPAILPLAPDSHADGVPARVPRRIALVVQTSGSTGRPKRVALSADALLAGTAATESALGGPGQWLLALPAHYIAGINVLTRSIAADTIPVVLPPGPFDPIAFGDAAARMEHPVRFASLVPVQLARLMDESEVLTELRRFDRILVGGQSTPDSLLAQALELGLNVTRTYGSSETAGGCVYDGIPISGALARVTDGQIELAGPMLADGYLDDPQRTAASFYDDAGERWYRTGDLGELADGVLTVTGRSDDQIVSGGVNVSLGAVERVVRGLPGLADAVVLSARSARWGDVPIVVSTRRPALDDVRHAVSAQLGQAAAPAAVFHVARIPLLFSGKPDRAALARLVPETV
jgi:o-succinylbenzoate---CoA ligase